MTDSTPPTGLCRLDDERAILEVGAAPTEGWAARQFGIERR